MTKYVEHGTNTVHAARGDTAARTEYMREWRRRVGYLDAAIQREARRLAAELVRDNLPDVWMDLCAEARETVTKRRGAA